MTIEEKTWIHIKNAFAEIAPRDYASLNEALEKTRAGIRIGPPVTISSVVDPLSSGMVGFYMREEGPGELKTGYTNYLEEKVNDLQTIKSKTSK